MIKINIYLIYLSISYRVNNVTKSCLYNAIADTKINN